MKKVYYVSGIYFTKNVEDLTSWFLVCKNNNIIFKEKFLLERFRLCRNNHDRAKFLSLLIDEELDALISLVNLQEFCCIVNIIKRLVVSDHKVYIEELFESLSRGKKKLIEKETEILVNNKLTRVKLVREVVSFE